jgi:hypothetical protein
MPVNTGLDGVVANNRRLFRGKDNFLRNPMSPFDVLAWNYGVVTILLNASKQSKNLREKTGDSIMRKLLLSTAVASLALVLFAAPSFAQDGDKPEAPQEKKERPEGRRGSKDGKRGEGKGRRGNREEMMKKFDTNKDGKLDEKERKAMMTARVDAMFKRADTDADGKISADEAKTLGGLGKFIVRADENKDGVVTKDELEKAFAKRRGKGKRGAKGKRGGKDGKRGGKDGKRGDRKKKPAPQKEPI